MRVLVIITLLCGGCAGPLSPSPVQAQPVDVLDYIIGQPDTWPRVGTQAQHQVVDWGRQEVCWVKYGRAEMFECWRWDERYIYHVIDHALDGETGESYSFTDGRWMPRYLSGGWALDVTENRIAWYSPSCSLSFGLRAGMPGTGLFPYHVSVIITGGILTLTYAPHAPGQSASSPETFTFEKGRGWVRWESNRGVATFDKLGGEAIEPARNIACNSNLR